LFVCHENHQIELEISHQFIFFLANHNIL
jgi:hypothetical protein